MDNLGLHQEHAKKLLSEAGASLTGPTPAELDPQLANAQAASDALARANAPKQPDLPPVAQMVANPANPTGAPSEHEFIANLHQQAVAKQASENFQMSQNPPAPDPEDPEQSPDNLKNMPSAIITGPADATIFAGQLRDKALAHTNADANKAEQVARDAYQTDVKQAQMEKPLVDDLARKSDESMQRLQTVNASVQEEQKQKMANFQSVQSEMTKMAMEQPKDLMGQAGVNSMLGHIAIFLGGAGVNGFHENHNLQMIQSMADRNVAAQKNRYEMLQRAGQGEQTMYGMLQQKLQSTTQVEAALRSGYYDAYTAHMKSVAGQFAGNRAKQKMDAGIAGIEQLKHHEMEKVDGDLFNRGVQITQLADAKEATMIKAQAAAAKFELDKFKVAKDVEKEQYARDQDVKHNSFIGTKGTSSPSEHGKLADMWGGARNMVMNLDEAKKIMMAPKNFANARAFSALQNINLGEAKKFFNTGARLEPKEVKMMEAVGISMPMFFEAMLNHGQIEGGGMLTGTQIAAGLTAVQGLIARNAYGSLQGHVQGLEWDQGDKVMGRFAPENYTPEYEVEATKAMGTEEGRARLKNATVYEDTLKNGFGE